MLVMTWWAQGLSVVLIEEQLLITLMRLDVIADWLERHLTAHLAGVLVPNEGRGTQQLPPLTFIQFAISLSLG
jgi:hypothetical protein